jgi:hypothetical protein
MPILSSDAANAQPVSGQADAPTVPRRVVGGAAVAGAARASSQHRICSHVLMLMLLLRLISVFTCDICQYFTSKKCNGCAAASC